MFPMTQNTSSNPPLQETPLAQAHREMGGKMVDFGGWLMPVNYGSQMEEHHHVRRGAGMFDVSHMTVIDIDGADARPYLRFLLANDVDKLNYVGKALYSGMLNDRGGVIDDLIVYRLHEGYRLVVNCATREKDLRWLETVAEKFDVNIRERAELAMVAVQGPRAREAVHQIVEPGNAVLLGSLQIFAAAALTGDQSGWYVGRTGYTGEDGYEIILPAEHAVPLWQALAAEGVKPCGLGARDTLRLEAGMNLYGHEMNEDISPLVANMGWTVAWEPAERDFVGKTALAAEKARGVAHKLVGLVWEGRGVLRAEQEILAPNEFLDFPGDEASKGVVTSGTFSPTLGYSIALARVPVAVADRCQVLMRGKPVEVRVTKPVFVRGGQAV